MLGFKSLPAKETCWVASSGPQRRFQAVAGFTAGFRFLELRLHNRTSDTVAKVIIILEATSKYSCLWKVEVRQAILMKDVHSFAFPFRLWMKKRCECEWGCGDKSPHLPNCLAKEQSIIHLYVRKIHSDLRLIKYSYVFIFLLKNILWIPSSYS